MTADELNEIAKKLDAESKWSGKEEHPLIKQMKYEFLRMVDAMVGSGMQRVKINPYLAEIARYIIDRIVPDDLEKESCLSFAEKKRLVMSLIGMNPVHIDIIRKQSGLSVEDVSACLCALELKNRVRQEAGGLFRLSRSQERIEGY